MTLKSLDFLFLYSGYKGEIRYVRFLNMIYLCILNAKIGEEGGSKNIKGFFKAFLLPNGILM